MHACVFTAFTIINVPVVVFFFHNDSLLIDLASRYQDNFYCIHDGWSAIKTSSTPTGVKTVSKHTTWRDAKIPKGIPHFLRIYGTGMANILEYLVRGCQNIWELNFL